VLYLPPLVAYAIIVLIVGILVLAFGYVALRHFKYKRIRRSIITLFAMGIAGGIAHILLFNPLVIVFNPAVPYHYNSFAIFQAPAVTALVLFLCYLPVVAFLGSLKAREVLVVAIVTSAVTIPAVALAAIVILTIVFSFP